MRSGAARFQARGWRRRLLGGARAPRAAAAGAAGACAAGGEGYTLRGRGGWVGEREGAEGRGGQACCARAGRRGAC